MLGRKPVPNAAVVTAIAALVAVAVIGACDRPTTSPTTNQSTFAAHVLVQSGNSQTGPATLALPAPVTVMVTDAAGAAITGATVKFAVRLGGGSVSTTTTTSSATGTASTSWTLGTSLGAQRLVAILNNGLDSAAFTATATNGPAAQIVLISGSGQVGRSGQILANPLVVEVHDATGAILSGVPVAFTQAAGNLDAFVSTTPVTTGVDGRASVSWTLGKNTSNTAVPMSVSASPVGLATAVVTFTATARPELRVRRDVTPFLQVDTTGATLGSPSDYLAGLRDTLRIQVYDPTDSSGVQGVTVAWAGDGVPVNASTVTDNKGFAKSLWALVTVPPGTPNGTALPPSNIAKRMIATASTSASTIGSVEFQASVYPGRICSVTQDAVPPNPTITSSVSLNATVRDCNGFPVSGASVSFSVTAGSVSPTLGITNAAGQVSTTWTFSGTPGVQKLTAVATAQAYPYIGAAYPTYTVASVQSVTVVPLPPAAIVQTSAALPGAAVAGSAHPVTFHVTDATGAPVAGVAVTFAITAGAGSVSPGSAITSATGDVTTTWTLGAAASGVQTMTATAGTAVATVAGGTVP